MRVFVAGGTGFIGRPLCRFLANEGYDVTAASRSPDEGIGGVDTVSVDVTRDDLSEYVDGHDAVVNLVALPSHVQPRGRSHESVHLRGTERLVEASEETGVERFVQMSGLGADSGVKTAYFKAKRRAEEAVRLSDLDEVILRPSVVFGNGCAFLPFLRKVTPPFVGFFPEAKKTRIQPIHVDDLAPMVADCVEDSRHEGEVYEIGGPEKLTMKETIEAVCGVRVFSVPKWFAFMGFAVADPIPFVPFGMDQYRVLGLDNTVEENDAEVFGFSPTQMQSLERYIEEES